MKKVLVTTTDSLQGWEIVNYIEPIYASVVLATGLFSENGITLSEYFSLFPSKHYTRNINNINQRAIDILKAKALTLGANTILGLKVDVDEISDHGGQMFMITAWGTAVIAKNISNPINTNNKEFDKYDVNKEMNIIRLIEETQKASFTPQINDLQLISNNASPQFKEFIFNKYLESDQLNIGNEGFKQIITIYNEYFSVLDPRILIPLVYNRLLTETNENSISKILDLIKRYDLLDYSFIIDLLTSSFSKRKLALSILQNDKASYSSEDIFALEKTIFSLQEAFPKAEIILKEILSVEKEVWICMCEQPNSLDHPFCYNCSKDQYGFRESEIKPSDVITLLNNKLLALKSLLA